MLIASHAMEYYDEQELPPSLTALHPQVHPFERDIADHGVRFDGMPWPKPLRFPFDRFDRGSTMDNYPFYTMEGRSLHEVNVGPIHAESSNPARSCFICNGEQVFTSNRAGYQHRGVEANSRLRPTACGKMSQ